MDVRNRTDLSLNDPVGESDLQEHLERLTSQHLEENGTELIELQLAGNRNRRMIRIYVDRPGGISIGQCAMLSRGIADLLDTHEPVDGTYTLEVSSPGLNRPIKSERDYKWAVQKQVRLVIQGRSECIGTLMSFSEKELLVKVNGEVQHISRGDVAKANLHFEI